EAVVGQNQQPIRNRRRQRIIRGVHHDSAKESFPYCVTGAVIGMRVIPVGARRAGANGEGVLVLLTRSDRMERTAIGLEPEMNAVPMDGCRFRQIVLK